MDIVNSFNDKRIRIIINPNGNGYSINFAHAINNAKGDILFISDQDDVWIEGKVTQMVAKLNNCYMTISDATIVDANLNLLQESHFALRGVKKGFWINFFKTRYIGACMAFRREILAKALPFPKHQKYCAYDYWLALVSEFYYKVELEETALIKYRRHGENTLTGGDYSTNSIAKQIITRLYTMNELLNRIRK